jgi:hypothetical protein
MPLPETFWQRGDNEGFEATGYQNIDMHERTAKAGIGLKL